MRRLALAALALTVVLMAGAQILAQSGTSPTGDAPRGAADDRGAFSPVWIVLVAVGFVVFVMIGMFWRRRQGPRQS